MTLRIEPGERLWSLDTLRGFDMFWIIGGDAFFQALAGITGWGWAKWGAAQLEHAEWAGFHFYNLIRGHNTSFRIAWVRESIRNRISCPGFYPAAVFSLGPASFLSALSVGPLAASICSCPAW